MPKIRCRPGQVGAFPDAHSTLMLRAARLRHIAGTNWEMKRYLVMAPLDKKDQLELHSA